jgi:hypothetical protein
MKVQALYPAPLIDQNFANFSSFGATTSSTTEYDIKVDHNFSEKDKISVRWSEKRTKTDQPAAFGPEVGGPLPGTLGPGYSKNTGRQAVVNWIHLFGARATNNLNIGWFDQYPKRTIPGSRKYNNFDLGIFGMPNGGDRIGVPYFNFTNFEQLGPTTDTLFFELQTNNNLTDVASVVLGRHTLKFGGEARHIRTDNLQPGPQNTAWTFNSFFTDQRGVSGTGFDYAGFLLGLPSTMNYTIYPDYFRSRISVYALFLQDDLRLNRNLTLNLCRGLRSERIPGHALEQ